MAAPTVTFNNSTGSDTAASGAGPATALSGTGASTNGTTSVDLSADAPDLSGVATDGTAALWVDSSSGRQWSRITAVDNGTDVVTVATAFSQTESSRNWGIGGKRSTLEGSKQLFQDVQGEWAIEIEETGTDYPLTSGNPALNMTAPLSTSGNLPCRLFSDSATRPKITFDRGNLGYGDVFAIGGCWLIEHIEFEHEATNGALADIFRINDNDSHVEFVDCILDMVGGTGATLMLTNDNKTETSFKFVNCDILLGDSTVFYGTTGTSERDCVLFNTYVSRTGATNNAIDADQYDEGRILFWIDRCIFDGGGIELGSGYGRGGVKITNCTIYNSVGDGIYLTGEAANCCIVQNNIISEAGGYGIRVDASATGGSVGNVQIDYNCIYNSTTGARSGYTAGDNEITSDPQMTDPANDDFTLGSSSPAIDAGNGTIGAL